MPDETTNVEDLIEEIHALLDKAWDLPLTGGRSVVDIGKIRDLLEEIRLGLPKEIRSAQQIVSDRAEILQAAKQEADDVVAAAKERAKILVSEEKITQEARAMADAMIADAQTRAANLRKQGVLYVDGQLTRSIDECKRAGEELERMAVELQHTREKLHAAPREEQQ